jgi:hypothetical protein
VSLMQASAQSFTIKNNTVAACGPISVIIYATDNNSSTCGDIQSDHISVAGGGTVQSFSSPLDVNSSGCSPAGSGPGWQSVSCLTNSTSPYFQGADVTVNGVTYKLGSACMGRTMSLVGSDCTAATVYIDLSTSGGNWSLVVHY